MANDITSVFAIFAVMGLDMITNDSLYESETLIGFGSRDIHTYRAMFYSALNSFSASDLVVVDPAWVLVFFQLTMRVKTVKRITTGLKFLTSKEGSNTEFLDKISRFISLKTTTSTRDSSSRFPLVKAPDSFPDICTLILALEVMTEDGNTKKEMAEFKRRLMDSLWCASLNFDTFLQDRNELFVKNQWNEWGVDGAKDANDNKIEFNKKIYDQSRKDTIRLINLDGTTWTTAAYTEASGYSSIMLNKYFKAIKAMKHPSTSFTEEKITAAHGEEEGDYEDADGGESD
jgi:hypothetical protein